MSSAGDATTGAHSEPAGGDGARRRRRPGLRDVGTDPDPRFTLANERTLLAWNRTALALVAGGLAVSQLIPTVDLPGGNRVLGLPLIALGGLLALGSYGRWQRVERAMRLGEPLPESPLPKVLAAGVVVGTVVAVFLAVLGDRS